MMLALTGGFVPLSIRTWPDTPEEALVRALGVAMLFAVIILATWWNLWWFNENRPNAYRRRLEKESAAFRTRWPGERFADAPYLELDQEAQRCWLLVLLLEGSNRSSDHSELAFKDIAAVRHWMSTVVAAMNAAADRDSRATGERRPR